MLKRSFVLLFILGALLMIGVGSVSAGTITISGDFSGDPTMPVVFISPPNCIGQGASPVRYDAHAFTVDLNGVYTFDLTSAGSYASIYLMNSGFNPAAAFPNCLTADNSAPESITFALTAGTVYYLVVFDDSFSQLGTTYTVNGSGPGNISLGVPGSCPIPLPSGSVVRNVPLGAPVYYAADLGTRTTFDLPAGNWYVGQISGDFAQVWIACQANLIWIPVTALGG